MSRDPLCRLGRKEIRENPDAIADAVAAPTHFCARCARASNRKKRLCKPVKIARVRAG
ncbi:MAG TPA: hypothetical protein PLK81_01520 [Kiritimatiellia bacterium]|nr:hypothetical protein [Kiritimatiellia bacterium]